MGERNFQTLSSAKKNSNWTWISNAWPWGRSKCIDTFWNFDWDNFVKQTKLPYPVCHANAVILFFAKLGKVISVCLSRSNSHPLLGITPFCRSPIPLIKRIKGSTDYLFQSTGKKFPTLKFQKLISKVLVGYSKNTYFIECFNISQSSSRKMDFTKDVRWKRIPLQDTVTCSRNCHLHNFISNYQLHNCNRNYHQDNWNRNCQLHNFNLNYYLHNYDRNWSGSTKKLDLKEQENNILFLATFVEISH